MTERSENVPDLRGERHEVLDERTRCLLRLRLVQAEIDLIALSGMVDTQPPLGTPFLTCPDAVLDLTVAHLSPSPGRLEELRFARQALLAYVAALDEVYSAVTEALVTELSADPGSCLPTE